MSLQVEVPIAKFVRTVTSANGEPWSFTGFEATDKGTKWITVAKRM